MWVHSQVVGVRGLLLNPIRQVGTLFKCDSNGLKWAEVGMGRGRLVPGGLSPLGWQQFGLG